MDSSSKRSATYDMLRAEVFRLRGKLKSVQDYSEQNFNHLSKRLKVYFEEIQKIASDTAAIQSVVEGMENTQGHLQQDTLRLKEYRSTLCSLFRTFQVIQRQCWKLKAELDAERNAFKALADGAALHCCGSDMAASPNVEVVELLEMQAAGIERLGSRLSLLLEPISQAVNALFFISKYFDLAETFVDGEKRSNSSLAALTIAVENDSRICLDSIGSLTTNIQMHDLVRQRIEHIDYIYETIIDELNGSGDADATSLIFLPIVPELARLHIAQLESAKEECLGAFFTIRDVLNTIDTRMGYSLEAYVELTCLGMLHDSDFNHRLERLMEHFIPSLLAHEQNYIQAVGGMQASFQRIKLGQLKARTSMVGYLNGLVQKQPNNSGFRILYDEAAALISDMRTALLKLEMEVANISMLFTEAASQLEQVSATYGKSHKAFYNNSVYSTYAKKCGTKEHSPLLSGWAYDENTREVHGRYTEFFGAKISEVVNDLERLASRPRLLSASEESIKRGFKNIEKVYTMQSERDIHRQHYLGFKGNEPRIPSSATAEHAAGDDNLELF